MLFFVDEAYEKADEALGGILPGGGTPGPFTSAARAVSEAIPIIDMVSPASANYYRDKVEADTQRGTRLATEAQEGTREILSRDILNSESIGAEARALTQQENEAANYGVVSYPTDGAILSTQEPGESNRDFYLQNQLYRESEQSGRIGASIRQTALEAEENRRVQKGLDDLKVKKPENVKGVGWVDSINQAENMSTAEGPEGGNLGCVYGVNKVIKASGREVPWKDPQTGEESVYIPYVTNWITSNGGQKVDPQQAKPGDIVTAGGGHMGILTDKTDEDGNWLVLSNSSSQAKMAWKFPLTNNHEVFRVPQLQN